MGKLDGRVAVVTGAASGIGKGIATAFAAEGADVVVADLVSEDGAAEVLDAIRAAGRETLFVRTDVGDEGSVREMARRLERSPSTISRELRRNMLPGDRGVYRAGLAHARSREHARRTRVGVFARDERLKQLVQDKLKVQWSPEQIAGWLRTEHPDRPEWHVCHETIYQGIFYNGTWRETCAQGGDFGYGAARLRVADPGSPCPPR